MYSSWWGSPGTAKQIQRWRETRQPPLYIGSVSIPQHAAVLEVRPVAGSGVGGSQDSRQKERQEEGMVKRDQDRLSRSEDIDLIKPGQFMVKVGVPSPPKMSVKKALSVQHHFDVMFDVVDRTSWIPCSPS